MKFSIPSTAEGGRGIRTTYSAKKIKELTPEFIQLHAI